MNQVWEDPIREIWVHNQFYGYVSHELRELGSAEIVDENTTCDLPNPCPEGQSYAFCNIIRYLTALNTV